MNTPKKHCIKCQGGLLFSKTGRGIFWRCRSCGAEYPLEQFADAFDDYLEELLANTRCDRF